MKRAQRRDVQAAIAAKDAEAEAAAQADAAKRKFVHPDGDHLTMLNAFNAFVTKQMDPDWCWNNYLSFRALKQANDVRN